MPLVDGIGTSKETKLKQQGFHDILIQILKVVDAISIKRKWNIEFLYIDGTCGCGRYNVIDENGDNVLIDGSPIIFYNCIKKVKPRINVNAYFIDENKKHIMNLRNLFEEEGNNGSSFFPMKYQKVLHMILKKEYPDFGLIYVDENGLPEFNYLSRLSQMEEMNRVDLLLRIPATAQKRKKGVWGGKDLDFWIKMTNKKFWYISTISGAYQWLFLFGTNTKTFRPDSKIIKFFDINSLMGERLFMKANLTKDVYTQHKPTQPSLYDKYQKV